MTGESIGYIVLTGIVEEEDGQFVSYCRELGTASCGDTISEALENLEDAINVHLRGLEEVGELDRTLRERQIRVVSQPPGLDGVNVNVVPGQIIKTYISVIPPVAHAV